VPLPLALFAPVAVVGCFLADAPPLELPFLTSPDVSSTTSESYVVLTGTATHDDAVHRPGYALNDDPSVGDRATRPVTGGPPRMRSSRRLSCKPR
jgi:hypothetical protein